MEIMATGKENDNRRGGRMMNPGKKYKGTCVVCGHKLNSHIDENEIWRCHSLGVDGFQCECALRKSRTIDNKIEYFDTYMRFEQMLNELVE